jgi:hypothetical protein
LRFDLALDHLRERLRRAPATGDLRSLATDLARYRGGSHLSPAPTP